MSVLSAELQAHLDSGTTTLAWAWKITRVDGTILGFTDHDEPLVFDSLTFESEAGLIASEVRAGSDLAVDAQDAAGVLTSGRITETDIADGLWDNASVEVYRVNWADTSQRSLRRKGTIGQIRRGRRSFVAEVRSITHVLGQTIGRTYQNACDADLGDARCGVDVESAAFKGTGTVTTLGDDRTFVASGLGAFASAWFTGGLVTWTTGANTGRVAEVAIHTTASVVLLDKPILATQVGDQFEIRAGCDKQCSTCAAKFNNVPNFRGFPSIPPQETVMRYASGGSVNDGAIL